VLYFIFSYLSKSAVLSIPVKKIGNASPKINLMID